MSSNPPTLDDSTLPTPSKEWADQAHAALTPDNGTQSAAIPGSDVPGAFPPEESIYPQTQAQAKGPTLERAASGDGVKDKVHHTAENYIAPERLDQAEHFVEGVGSKAAQYVPAGVASAVSSYWCEWKSSRSRTGAVSLSSSSSASSSKSMESDGSSSTSRSTERPPPQVNALWTGVGWLIVGTAWLIWGDGTSKSAASSTPAGTDSGATASGTTALPRTEKDSAHPESSCVNAGTASLPSAAGQAGAAKLPEERAATSDNITAAASTAAASSATDKDAASKENAGKAAADTGISGESSSTTGTLDGSTTGTAGGTPTSTSASASTPTSTAKPPAVEDAPTKTSAPAPTPAPAPASEIPPSSEPIISQPAEASTTPSVTDATASAAPAAPPQEQATETGKDTISPQDANEIPEGKDDGAKKNDEEAAAGVGAGLAGLGAGVAAIGLSDQDKKDDQLSQPTANLTPRRYALGSLPPGDEKGRGDTAGTVGGIEGARGAWDVAENKTSVTKKVKNTGPPPKVVEDGITGNRGGDNGDGDTKIDDEKNKKYADRISDLQALVQDGAARDGSAKAPANDIPDAAPAAPSEGATAKPKDVRSDQGYHPAALHPYIPNASSIASGTTGTSSSSQSTSLSRNTSPSASTKEKHGHVHQRTVSTSSVGSGSPRRKKVGFFDKVRGEAKVIVGKIEHKKEKVEEGKRILHGED